MEVGKKTTLEEEEHDKIFGRGVGWKGGGEGVGRAKEEKEEEALSTSCLRMIKKY